MWTPGISLQERRKEKERKRKEGRKEGTEGWKETQGVPQNKGSYVVTSYFILYFTGSYLSQDYFIID